VVPLAGAMRRAVGQFSRAAEAAVVALTADWAACSALPRASPAARRRGARSVFNWSNRSRARSSFL
jgi:hypothetical protein